VTTIAVSDETLQALNEGKVKAVAKLKKIPTTDEFINYLLELQDKEKC
jgi:hypothetical protein